MKSPNFWYWLAIPFSLVNGFFVANLRVRPELKPFADRPEMALVSSVFVLVFALPSFWTLVKWLRKRGMLALAALSIFAVGIESFAVATGFPYGHFTYGAKIGDKLFGLVPWTVPFAWTPVLLGSYALGSYALARRVARNLQKSEKWNTIFATALISTAFDLVLDPGAVSQNFWTYRAGGAFYGVPWTNFAGWILSGAVGALILHFFAQGQQHELPPKGLLGSLWLIALFWTGVCGWSGLWIPAAIGVALCVWVGSILLSHS